MASTVPKIGMSALEELVKTLSGSIIGDPTKRFIIALWDFEAYEFNRERISEIGIATLDSRDIKGVDPGDRGSGWWPYIKVMHWRVQENPEGNSVNVQGHPTAFLFGTTVIIFKVDIALVVRQYLEALIGEESDEECVVESAVGHTEENLQERSQVPAWAVGQESEYKWWIPAPPASKLPKSNNGLQFFQGAHDNRGDRRWSEMAGISWPFPGTTGEFDNQRIGGYLCEYNGRRIKADKLHALLGIPTHKTHNAGNDAAFELCATLAMTFATPQQRQSLRNELALPLLPPLWKEGWVGRPQPLPILIAEERQPRPLMSLARGVSTLQHRDSTKQNQLTQQGNSGERTALGRVSQGLYEVEIKPQKSQRRRKAEQREKEKKEQERGPSHEDSDTSF